VRARRKLSSAASGVTRLKIQGKEFGLQEGPCDKTAGHQSPKEEKGTKKRFKEKEASNKTTIEDRLRSPKAALLERGKVLMKGI